MQNQEAKVLVEITISDALRKSVSGTTDKAMGRKPVPVSSAATLEARMLERIAQ